MVKGNAWDIPQPHASLLKWRSERTPIWPALRFPNLKLIAVEPSTGFPEVRATLARPTDWVRCLSWQFPATGRLGGYRDVTLCRFGRSKYPAEPLKLELIPKRAPLLRPRIDITQ